MDAYTKVEHDILQEEKEAPLPALTHAISKLEKIMSDLEKLTNEATINQNFTFNQLTDGTNDVNELKNIEEIGNAIKTVMTELRVINNPKVASEQEEFIANLNRKAMKCRHIFLLNRRKLEIEEEAAKLSDRTQNLRRLYEYQDMIVGEILGSPHNISKTETEVDRLRNYRDALYSGELAWQDTIRLIDSASVFAQAGFSSWQTIQITSDEESKFQLATETRNAIHEAALLVQTAQNMLPTAQFPYCTQREIFAILQVIEYLYTDMEIPERYNHAKEVYKSFQKRTTALSKWLKELMNSTIHKDIEEVDKKLAEFTSKVNAERMIQIKKKLSSVNGILTAESIESLNSIHHQ